MGFVANVLGNVNGIQWYYILGLLIFVTLFLIILYRTYRMPKKDLVAYKTAILENDDL